MCRKSAEVRDLVHELRRSYVIILQRERVTLQVWRGCHVGEVGKGVLGGDVGSGEKSRKEE